MSKDGSEAPVVEHSTPDLKDRLFRVGTSGWNYDHWREVFYPSTLPPAKWFGYYRQLFDTVEIRTNDPASPRTFAVTGPRP